MAASGISWTCTNSTCDGWEISAGLIGETYGSNSDGTSMRPVCTCVLGVRRVIAHGYCRLNDRQSPTDGWKPAD